MNLGLHYDALGSGVEQILCGCLSFFRRGGHLTPRNGNAVLRKNILRLILVDLHWSSERRRFLIAENPTLALNLNR